MTGIAGSELFNGNGLGKLSGPPVPFPGDVHLFGRSEFYDARAWAWASGIALHMRSTMNCILEDVGQVRVYGRLVVLLEWCRDRELDPSRLPSSLRAIPPHITVTGPDARHLLHRTSRQIDEPALMTPTGSLQPGTVVRQGIAAELAAFASVRLAVREH
jgi:hypothetical protein